MKGKKTGKIIGRALLVVFTTLLLLLFAAAGALFVILRGPSVSAQELLTRSLKETSAAGFIPDLFLPAARVREIMSYRETVARTGETDTSLVTISATRAAADPAGTDSDTESTEEHDIEIEEITGAGYRGVLMIVRDPMRLFVGVPNSFGAVGLTLEQMTEKYDAIAGINAGGFDDPNGTGMGGTPEGVVITEGKLIWGSSAATTTIIGFDGNGILHAGVMSAQDALDRGIQWACSFGPALIVNGEPQSNSRITSSGVNPRTAIGQRADGAVLLLVVDGRQITSLGATLEDLISILLEHGAVNAANLDGGSSTLMLYEGEALNSNSSLIGTRPLPTAFLVRR